MGAYAPVSIATDELVQDAVRRIFLPTLAALRDHGRRFSGLLYAGLMLGRGALKVVEFNCRFGDPETEALLPLLQSSLLEVLSAATGGALHGGRLDWHDAAAVTTVVAAAGYPDTPRTGDAIILPAEREGLRIFHGGTAVAPDRSLVTAGGRVLALTATAATLAEAQRASTAAAAEVAFAGKQFRADIGWRDLQRMRAGATRD
jgi:phosphoribosylamine--glycine ligase